MACKKEIVNEPLIGRLDGRTQVGEANWRDFRVLLNTSMPEASKLGRMPGWHGLMKNFPCDYGSECPPSEDPCTPLERCNRDLHDQLLGCTGYFNHTYLQADATIPDLGLTVTLDLEDNSFIKVDDVLRIREFSKLVVVSKNDVTGEVVVRNNQDKGGSVIVDDEVLGDFVSVPSSPEAITMHAQLTSACETRLFVAATSSRVYVSTGAASNWRLLADGLGPASPLVPGPYSGTRWQYCQMGNYVLFSNDYDPVLAWRIGDEPECWQAWSAKYVLQLLEIDVLRAGCIAAWQGFVFVGDLETSFGRQCSLIHWSDFNSPLDWLPGDESASGFIDLGRGEKVLRLEPIAGYLKVFTDKAIYNVLLVGGDEVFRFQEIYRGPDTLAFRFAFANCGDSHIYLTTTGIVELKTYDNTPTRVEWLHRASGLMFRGLDGRLLAQYPGAFKAFQGMNTVLCNQIVAGYDSCRKEVWFSWPTLDCDEGDSEHRRRMSMVLSRIYQHASLVDHGFSSFCNFVPILNESVRDWMVRIGACTQEQTSQYVVPKEGVPCNQPNPPFEPISPADPDHLCDQLAQDMTKVDVKQLCRECSTPCAFSMASLTDFCLKELAPDHRYRERWTGTEWVDEGYELLIQSESTLLSVSNDKRVTRLEVDYSQGTDAKPLNLHSQIGVGAMPMCPVFWDSDPFPLDCSPIAPVNGEAHARSVGPISYPYYATGRYVTWRLYISSGENGETDYSPVGGVVDFNRVALTLSIRPVC
jgi:hypothetical protein